MDLKKRINAAIKDWPKSPKSKYQLNAGQRRRAFEDIVTKIADESPLGETSKTLILILDWTNAIVKKRAKRKAKGK